jgi:hypothetical protein
VQDQIEFVEREFGKGKSWKEFDTYRVQDQIEFVEREFGKGKS